MQAEDAKDGTELAVLARLVVLKQHADLENFAETEPELDNVVEAPVEEQVLQLRQVGHLQGALDHIFDLFLPCLENFLIVKSIAK